MAQKSILSFFKSSDQTSAKETVKKQVIIEDSPVKATKRKRKVQTVESDDESAETSSKIANDDSGGKSKGDGKGKGGGKGKNGRKGKGADGKKVKLTDENQENVPKEKNVEVIVNGNSSAKKSVKPKKNEEKKENHSPKPVAKSETSNSASSSAQNSTENSKTDDLFAKPSTSMENGFEEFIPKRKTARKQMGSSKNIKRYDEKMQEELESKDAKNEEEKSVSESQNEKCCLDVKETEISLLNSEVKELPESSIEASSEKESENKNLSDGLEKTSGGKHKAKNAPKAKNSPVKKTPKTESIHSFFTPLKVLEKNKSEKKIEDKGKSSEKIEDKAMHNENVDAEDKLEENAKKVDEKGKKTEKKNGGASKRGRKKREPIETDDSPVKKVGKRKKKIQDLESDDDDDNGKAVSESPKKTAKMETHDSEEKICDASSEKHEENSGNSEKSPENISDEGTSKSKKSTNESSKSGEKEQKQKFGVKSTSASGTVYNPSKTRYHPVEDACWKRNEKVPYIALAKTLELIENTSGRLKTIEFLANFLRSVIVLSPDDLLQSVYLCLNRLAPEYEGIELGIGETLLMKAVAQATGRTLEKIKAEVAVKGDLGLVSESSRGNQRVMFAPPKLTVSSVFSKFLEIAKMSGNAAMAKKTDKIQSLFVACRDCEARYIIRSLSGKLRIGLAEQSVLSAIARAAVQTPPTQNYPPEIIDASKGMSPDSFKELVDSQALILKTAYCECPNYDLIIPVLLKEGISALPDRCQLSPGRPLKPMLAHPTAGIDKVLERFDKNAFTCEFKYDGERAQIHMIDNGDVKIFSRNQEDNTSKYPDVISRITKALKETTKSFILDSEAVAWDKATKQILPFQVLSTRKKKDAVESEIVVQVCIMAFDLLYLNGESLVKKPLKERRSLLHSSFQEVENEFTFAQYKDGNSAETMQEFLDESVKGNCEGLMVKSLEVDASYEIAKRSHNWLKLKKDYLQGIGDTLDLVVIGGYYGKGKRTGNYGGFLLACYDDENEEFQSICKLGTGFKDEILETHTSFLKQHVIKEPKSYFRYDHSLEPDDWFEPVQVWEIKCADLSISPVHKAAIGIIDPEKGISLRFPRFIRIRDDKTPENATNSAQIADMYQKQQQIQNTANKNSKMEEDFY